MMWLAIVICSMQAGAMAQGPPLRLSEYQKQTWQVEEGLPENNVRMIAQQPNGMLLLATSAGLASFDGQRFQSFGISGERSLASEAVNAIAYGSQGDLWVGTDGHGVLHVTAAGTARVSEAAGRFGERVRMLHVDAAGVLWVATQNGVERCVGERLETVGESGMISGDLVAPFAEDGEGGMFFVTSAGVFDWRAGVVMSLPMPLRAEQPTALHRGERGTVWVGTTIGVHVVERGGAVGWRMGKQIARLPGPVSVMLEDAAGSLWIGTRHDGLWRKSVHGTEHWGVAEGMPDNAIRTLFVDDEKNLWVGMLTGGLSRWREGAFAPIGTEERVSRGYAAVPFADSRGDLWLGTWGEGLFRRHAGVVERVSLPGVPNAEPIRSMAEDREGKVWVGTWFHGVYRYDGRRFTQFLTGAESPGNAMSVLLASRVGALWVGTYDGVLRYPRGVPVVGKAEHLLPGRLVTTMLEDDDGSVLVGTATGLFRVRGDEVAEITGLPHPYVLSFVRDHLGAVWVGTRAGGLAELQINRVVPVGTGNGLSRNAINTMIEDADGNLWLGTSRGVVRLQVEELHRVARGEQTELPAVLLDKEDGMQSSECSGPSRPLSTRMPDGTLWFAATKGFVRTTRTASSAGRVAPQAAIRGWVFSNDASASDVLTGDRVVLRAGEPDVLFFFWAKNLANPTAIEFRYRLAGYDREWTLTRARVARYRRLPPGDYQMEVQARNSGGGWNSPAATLRVKQEPHFYQAWYFFVGLALLAIMAAWEMGRRRIRRVKGSMGIVLEERNRISRECHDTLMAGFAAVSWQLEATAKLFRDGGAPSAKAVESFEMARSMVSLCQAEARRIIWDLRDAEEVTSSLSTSLARMLDVNHINQRAMTRLEIDGEEIPLAPGSVHHLTCIGQEAVTNALRHAQPTHVTIRLRYDDAALHLAIRDDGRGFQPNEARGTGRGHFGIPVMEERARKLGGALMLESSPENGTEVTVSVPFGALQQPMRREQDVVRWIGI
jgi:signal transduction histidine kinase/ligand-binding sensor domain-containing protein